MGFRGGRPVGGRWTRPAAIPAVVTLGAALAVAVLAAPPADAAVTGLFAYPAGGASSPTGCPQTATAADQCTLTQALALAGAGDTVELASAGPYDGTYTLNTAGTSATSPVTIEPASGVSNPVLDGGGNGTVLTVPAGVHAVLDGVTITGAGLGASSAGCIVFLVYTGGGIVNHGTLTVDHATFNGNQLTNSETGGELGGAIYNDGTLDITGSTFTDNSTGTNGEGEDEVDAGGAIFNAGRLDVTGSSFSNNLAGMDGGAIDNDVAACGAAGPVLAGPGTATITDSTFTSNNANFGSGIDNGRYGAAATMTVTGSTFTDNGNDGGTAGGGIYNNGRLTVSGTQFINNQTQDQGAGIYTGGSLTVTTSDFDLNGNNQLVGNLEPVAGGAIDDAGGPVSVTDSTFYSNDASTGGGIDVAGSATVVSSTFDYQEGADIAGGTRATLAADVIGDGCSAAVTDAGYNVDSSGCGLSAAQHSTSDFGSLGSYLGQYGDHGGPLPTIPLRRNPIIPGAPANPVLDVIPASFVAPGATAAVCSGTDERGVQRPAPCSSGAYEPVATPGLALFAYPSGGAGDPSSCPQTSTVADQCTLAQALDIAQGGDTVELAVSGADAVYQGFWTVDVDSSQTDPLTIEPAPGVSEPILEGGKGVVTGTLMGTLYFAPGTSADLRSVVLQDGAANCSFCGSAITADANTNLTLDKVTVRDNWGGAFGAAGGFDGAVVASGDPALPGGTSPGSLTVTDSTFSDNASYADYGLITSTSTRVTDSSFTNSTAVSLQGPVATIVGSTFDNEWDVSATSISDSTFAFSTTPGQTFEEHAEATTITHSTFVNVQALDSGLAGDLFIGGFTGGGGTSDACTGNTDDGYNIEDNDACAFTAATSVNNSPDLDSYVGSLADNGGPTQTVALLPGNAAVGMIPPDTTVDGVALCPTTDQRGVASQSGVPCDAGALQLVTPPPSTTALTVAPALNGLNLTATVTGAAGYPAPTGTVTVAEGGTTLCANAPVSAGQAACYVSPVPSGAATFTATYHPATTYRSSSGTVSIGSLTTLYVATGGVDAGNDTCAQAAPCATIAYADLLAAPTATIHVGPGTVSGAVSLSGKTITIVGDPGGTTLTAPAGDTALTLDSGTLTLTDLTVSGASFGIDEEGGTLTVVDSAITGNREGGIAQDGGRLTVANSTIAGSTDEGILAGDGTASIVSSTIADNGQGIVTEPADAVTVSASILARNTTADCAGTGTPTDAGYNVDDDASCGFAAPSIGDSAGIDGYLGALGDYGGPTRTIPLLDASADPGAGPDPAVGLVPATADVPGTSTAICAAPDQRGVDRQAPCAAGSYELHATTTALASSADPSVAGNPVTFTATITPVPDGGGVTVTVDGTSACASASLNASGRAVCTVADLTAGKHTVVAAYSGDGAYAASTSTSLTQTVTAPTVPGAPTGASAVAGNGSAVVSFTPPAADGGAAITSYTVTAADLTSATGGGQTASGAGSPITVTGLTDGDSYTFTVTATNRVGAGAASAPSAAVTPARTPTTTGLDSSQNPTVAGRQVTLTATITPAAATGTVDFAGPDGTSLPDCGARPVSSGSATCAVSFPAAGSDAITATYGGNADYAGSTGTLTEDVHGAGVPTTTIDVSPPGLSTGPVTITIDATDTDTQARITTRCVLDPKTVPTSYSDLPPAPCPYLGSGATVTAGGAHTVYAASTDSDGNTETTVRSASFTIDDVPPVSTVTASHGALQHRPLLQVHGTGTVRTGSGVVLGTLGPVDCWDGDGVVLTLAATDQGSGVAGLTYAATGAQPIATTTATDLPVTLTITSPGLTTVTFYATDKAGNAESPEHSETVLVTPSGFGCAAATPTTFSMPASGSVTITGTATAGGHQRSFTVTITFGRHGAAVATPLRITTVALPPAAVGAPYAATLRATGGIDAPLTWSLAPGAAVPPGLHLAADGVISGRPTRAGSYRFRVSVNDPTTASLTLRVQAPAVAATGGTTGPDTAVATVLTASGPALAATGTPAGTMLALAVVLLLAGAGTLAAARFRAGPGGNRTA